jgi:hypothetical protein
MQATLTDNLPSPRPSTNAAAPRVLFVAIALGLLTQLLFFRADPGFSWLVWDVAMVGVTLGALSRGRITGAAIATATACLLLGFAFALRRSAFSGAVALPTNLALLAALPVVVREELSFAELGLVPGRMLGALPLIPFAIGRTVTVPRDAVAVLDGGGRNVMRRSLAGLLLGFPLAGLFTLLLCADSNFAHAVARVEARLSTAVSFTLHVAVTALVYLFTHALLGERSAAPASVDPEAPYRTVEEPSSLPHVSPLTWGIVLAQVAAVFLAYVAVHRDTEFGGHAVVRGRADITYASHLHAGFYQLLFATILAVCLVVAGHRILRVSAGESPVPGGLALKAIESALLVLTGLTLFSCVNRLRLYEEAYGATHLRVGVAFVALAAFAVLLCTLAKSVFRDLRSFGAATLTSLVACATLAALFDADGYIARTNLDRASRGKHLDTTYLISLSADACAAADHPVLTGQPELRRFVIEQWSANSQVSDVRSRRGFQRCPAVAAP